MKDFLIGFAIMAIYLIIVFGLIVWSQEHPASHSVITSIFIAVGICIFLISLVIREEK